MVEEYTLETAKSKEVSQEMNESEQLYTLGIWSAKVGKEAALIEAWREFAQWTAAHQPGAGEARMLQDIEHPQRFITFGPWEDTRSVQEWRQSEAFREFVAKARELCEHIQPYTLKTVAYIARS